MKIRISDESVVTMGKLAVLAASPVGMGMLHFNAGLKFDDIKFSEHESRPEQLSIDYYQGRMTKFFGRKIAGGEWEFSDDIRSDYQSWCSTFPSYEQLAAAAVLQDTHEKR